MDTLSERDTSDPQSQRNDTPSQVFAETPRATYPPLVGMVMAMAALYFGRDIFIPLAIAILLTFALAPGVSWLRKLRAAGDNLSYERSVLAQARRCSGRGLLPDCDRRHRGCVVCHYLRPDRQSLLAPLETPRIVP